MVIPNMNAAEADFKKAFEICKKHPGCNNCPMINGQPLVINEPIINNDKRMVICQTGQNKTK